MPSGLWKTGHWAWIPDTLVPDSVTSNSSPTQASQININHVYGRTDSYRPSAHDDLRRRGITPPARGSGSRVFKSSRRSPPRRVPTPPQRVSGNTRSHNNGNQSSGAVCDRRSRKLRHRHQRQYQPTLGTIDEQMIALSTPPANAPKAPLADRLDELNNSLEGLDVANTLLQAHRAPFKDYISATPCTNYLCSIGEPHQEGLYLHENKLSERPHGYFGAANPPPWLWQTYERVEKSEASDFDFLNLQYFLGCHPPFHELYKGELWE